MVEEGLIYFKIMPLPIHFSLFRVLVAIAAMVTVNILTPPTSTCVLKETKTGLFLKKRLFLSSATIT